MELLVAMAFLALALLSMLWMNTYSSKGSMDAYYEFLAFSLAREPIEVFRSFGYKWLAKYDNHPLARYPANSGPQQIIDSAGNPDQHPFEAGLFEREILIADADYQDSTTGQKILAKKVTVYVRPVKKSRVDNWLRKDEIQLEAFIVDGPH